MHRVLGCCCVLLCLLHGSSLPLALEHLNATTDISPDVIIKWAAEIEGLHALPKSTQCCYTLKVKAHAAAVHMHLCKF
jgi:hypothetical protein